MYLVLIFGKVAALTRDDYQPPIGKDAAGATQHSQARSNRRWLRLKSHLGRSRRSKEKACLVSETLEMRSKNEVPFMYLCMYVFMPSELSSITSSSLDLYLVQFFLCRIESLQCISEGVASLFKFDISSDDGLGLKEEARSAISSLAFCRRQRRRLETDVHGKRLECGFSLITA